MKCEICGQKSEHMLKIPLHEGEAEANWCTDCAVMLLEHANQISSYGHHEETKLEEIYGVSLAPRREGV